jgi:signal transduction histidine kinase
MIPLACAACDDQGRASQWYGLLIDIDERKSMEEAQHNTELRLSRVTQIATLGELSASIAHEINQPLAAVLPVAVQSIWSDQPPIRSSAGYAAKR